MIIIVINRMLTCDDNENILMDSMKWFSLILNIVYMTVLVISTKSIRASLIPYYLFLTRRHVVLSVGMRLEEEDALLNWFYLLLVHHLLLMWKEDLDSICHCCHRRGQNYNPKWQHSLLNRWLATNWNQWKVSVFFIIFHDCWCTCNYF